MLPAPLSRELNAGLASSELEMTRQLEEANASLERSFVDTIRLLSSLVETLNPSLGTYLNFVAQLAKRMGHGSGLDKQEQGQIETAGLLHDIGLLGLLKMLLNKNMEDMVEAEL
jgi:response regulator RpfG family c-di-GMP phosphodiesterase